MQDYYKKVWEENLRSIQPNESYVQGFEEGYQTAIDFLNTLTTSKELKGYGKEFAQFLEQHRDNIRSNK